MCKFFAVLHQSAGGHGNRRAVTHHEVVQQPDIQQGQRIFQPSRDGLVRQARFTHARWVIVRRDKRGGAVPQGLLGHHPWVDGGAVDGAVEQFLVRDDAMAGVQEQAGEHFVRVITQHGFQVLLGQVGTLEGTAAPDSLTKVAFRQFEHSHQLAAFCRPQARLLLQGIVLRLQKAAQAPKAGQQLLRDLHDRPACGAGAEQNGQQFGIAKCADPQCSQLFPRHELLHGQSVMVRNVFRYGKMTRLDVSYRFGSNRPDGIGTMNAKRIVLGVTGGIAAYKSADLVRRLQDAGAEVRVVMTRGAQAFVTPLTFQAVSGNPVHTNLLDEHAEAGMGHIELARWADQVLVAPATADFMARLAHGLADDLLTTLCLATAAPLTLAPAMNRHMWSNPATVANRDILETRGVRLLGPGEGSQACGESGPGRILEPAELAEALIGSAVQSLSGRRVLVTAGPTHEDLDPVRFIGNRSSGRMGFAVAAAAARAGAEVILVAGPVQLESPQGVERRDVRSAREMHAEVMAAASSMDVFIGVAAVADYRPADPAPEKIKKGSGGMEVSLVANPDIIADVAALENSPFTVGFAAETEKLEEHALDKLSRKRLDMIAANRVGQEGTGFEVGENEILLLSGNEKKPLGRGSKQKLAELLVEEIAARINGKERIETRSNQDS